VGSGDDFLPKAAREFRSLTVAEWLLFAALLTTFVILGFLPAWRTMNTDFPNYYLAASIHRQGVPLDRAYEWRWFQRHKDHLQIDQSLVGFAPHPPMCAVPMLPLTWLPSLEAKRVWLVLNLGFLALALWILRRVTQISWRRLLFLTFLCILPLRENFLFGQYYLLILLLLCVAYYAYCRGRHFTSGAVLAAAASLKIFPVFFLILFLRKRNWRASAGMVTGGAVLAAISLLLFGWDVHRIYLLEVLPRALHGDLVGPYVLQWNSFTALCHRFFLAEPEMNPTPWVNSATVYGFVQAIVATVLLFSFLLSTGEDDTPQTTAWEWATFLPLLILLSSMPTAYHHCVLILSVVVAIDFLLKAGRRRSALAVAVLFAIACYPLPGYAWLNLQGRLAAVFVLYVLLLFEAPVRARGRVRTLGFALAAVFLAVLALSNLRALRNRSEDFSLRLPPVSAGYGTFSVARAGDRLVLDEMVPDAFAAVTLPDGGVQRMPAPGDVLSVAASPQSPFIYFELTNQSSQILRLPVAQLGRGDAVPEYVGEGHAPAVSADGRWLAYLREEHGKTTIWLSKDGLSKAAAPAAPALGSQNLAGVLEMSVTPEGNLIVAAGGAGTPHLSLLQTASGEVHVLTEIRGAVRYPAISADGKWLAFSRRDAGAWHLIVRDLVGGAEQQLTSAACNATSPAWEDSRTLLYVSDCGRGLGLGATTRVVVQR
jgi:hypothetical protein